MEQLSISKCCYDNCILYIPYTAQKMKLSIKDFSSKCNQIRRFLRIWSHLLEKSLMENFIFCAVQSTASEETVDPSSHSNVYFSVEVDHETVIQTLVARIII